MRRSFLVALPCYVVVGLLFAGGALAQEKARPTPAFDWKTLRAAHEYKRPSPFPVEETTQADTDYLRVHFAFTSARGKRVTGLFLRPKAEGVYPCALLLHGVTGSKETIVERFGKTLLSLGVATLSLDADFHGERKQEGKQPRDPSLFVQIVHDSVVEYRQAIDYLQTRKDVDAKRIGLSGYSMGAMMGALISGVDTRLRYTVLMVGGDLFQSRIRSVPADRQALLQEASPANYVGHISPRPVLLINGTKDIVVNRDAAERVQRAAREPKEIRWIEGGEHELPKEDIRKGIEDLAEHLKK